MKNLKTMAVLMLTALSVDYADCKVSVVTTLNGNPSLKAMDISILQGTDVVQQSKGQHSYTTQLACNATYKAVIIGNGKTRERVFTLQPNTATDVTVAMD